MSMPPADPVPFSRFLDHPRSTDPLRRAITTRTRAPERDCVRALATAARLSPAQRESVRATGHRLVTALRSRPPAGGVQALVQEYALSSHEGVALMCLAEALLRIPDTATRDALIRDKLADGNWAAHLGDGRSLFVNAATWGLVVTGRLASSADDRNLAAALTRLVARLGEPVVRKGVDLAMRLMGQQFVTGQTIAEALHRARAMEAKGFAYSYDMLGEAAMTMADANRYHADYEAAIHAIGAASAGRGVIAGPGISIKLSALHPRYTRSQQDRVHAELLARVRDLALLARRYDIGLNIDAEEADRLELSLDLLEALATDPALAGWDGLGFVVQAYGKRCPLVIDWLVQLARRSGRRIAVRLVKGAYWDTEIKRAQVEGLPGFPVYTRKVHTDVAYLACARKLLANRDALFPQFATHNAQTVATIMELAGRSFTRGDWEFQCLHGMGEPLYEQVVADLGRPCRIYAPVGTHETLLAYLVRRLLENGANSSFVNRLGDPAVPVDALLEDPAEAVLAGDDPGGPHPAIALPQDILAPRRNSAGLDLADESVLATLADSLLAAPPAGLAGQGGNLRPVRNPADSADIVGHVAESDPAPIAGLAARAAASDWRQTTPAARARLLEAAADAFEGNAPALIALAIREAGKSAANAVGEVREAVDFLRYYAVQARDTLGRGETPLGPVACISPWNFPLAIFTGQIAAALAAGNPVIAKPAEETPLIAAEAVRLLHAAGIPDHALQLVCGEGEVGAALVDCSEIEAVLFTGSTAVARSIQRQLAARQRPDRPPIALVAETGGQNAMIVDSSALAEQVVADVIASAFDSAGQRCSALRLLCLQTDIADRTLAMLKGAMAELRVGPTDRLRNDIGPVITAEARDAIEAVIAARVAEGRPVHRLPLGPECAAGTFVAPTVIELASPADLGPEVFGPVLHVVRWRSGDLDTLIDAINATGYALTFGLHTRLDATTAHVLSRVHAGNRYINRNTIGAVVGVQPFGGHGLSGTGPKAGGPLTLRRLVRNLPPALPAAADLPGPVGETNRYETIPRGAIALLHRTDEGRAAQQAALAATGNPAATGLNDPALAAVLAETNADAAGAMQILAQREGPIVPVLTPEAHGYPLDMLVLERSTCTNTTAAGGNASLMTLA